jgi:pimeloyl-ACP methyl ester carboxylesterase
MKNPASFTGRFCLVVAILASVAGASDPARCQISLNPPMPSAVRSAIQARPAEEQLVLQQSIAETHPVVIFLPGVLGSKLTRGSTVIWGQLGTLRGTQLVYSESDRVTRDLLAEFTVPLYGGIKNVYGRAASTIQALSLGQASNLLIFTYDWRQSNVKTANELSEFICKNQQELQNKPVVFVAHSMGGIVLKYWLAKNYHTHLCNNGERLDQLIGSQSVKRVVFVGTPHLGAPKALSALANRYYVLADEDSSWLMRNVVDPLVTAALNRDGGSFPSAYELLPYVASKCHTVWHAPPVYIKVGGQRVPVANIFHYPLWREYHWPKEIFQDDLEHRTTFVNEQLRTYLKNAEELSCLLSQYDPDKEFPVVRFYGTQSKPDTTCSVTIIPKDVPSQLPVIEREKCLGDGTVPVDSASEMNKGIAFELTGEHLALLSTDKFISYLVDLFYKAERELNQTYAAKTSSDTGPVEFYASLGRVVPSDLEPSTPEDTKENEVTIRTNAAVVQRLDEINRRQSGTTALGVYRTARNAKTKDKENPIARANAFRVAATLPTINHRSQAWAYNNAADISLCNHEFRKARTLGLKAIDEANSVEVVDQKVARDMRKLTALAALTVARAAQKLGDSDTDKRYRQLAIQNGNPKARTHAAVLDIRCQKRL